MSVQMSRIIAKIERHQHALEFDRDGLGERLVRATARSILSAIDQETSPTGSNWLALSQAYAAWKAKSYPGMPMAVQRGHMKAIGQLVGEYSVSRNKVTQTYGTDELAHDLAAWFSSGDPGQYRPPRPFYQFGPVVIDQVTRILGQSLKTWT